MLAVNNLEYKEKHREQTCVILEQSKTGIVQSPLPIRHPKFAGHSVLEVEGVDIKL